LPQKFAAPATVAPQCAQAIAVTAPKVTVDP